MYCPFKKNNNTYWILHPVFYKPAREFFLNGSSIILFLSLKLQWFWSLSKYNVLKMSFAATLQVQAPYLLSALLPTTLPFTHSLTPWQPSCCSIDCPALPYIKTFAFAIPSAWNTLPPDNCWISLHPGFYSNVILSEALLHLRKIELYPHLHALSPLHSFIVLHSTKHSLK